MRSLCERRGGRLCLLGMLGLAALAAAVPARAQGVDPRLKKKIIETGWDHVDTTRLRENLALIEQQPFDGLVVEANGRVDDKRTRSLRPVCSADKWERAWFQSCVDDLKAVKPTRPLDTFVITGANPGNVDWFDDAGWANVVEHFRIAAWVSRQGNTTGILFDHEPYAQPFSQFKYGAQAERDKHSFDEYYAKARERGRQVMGAIAEEYPNVTLFCYFMNSVNANATGHVNPKAILANSGYGLYPAFIDGWLDVAPPTVKMVDGCESAYRYNSTAQFLEAGLLMRVNCQELVSPENRAKYRAQVQVSFGIYLDAYWNPEGNLWYVDGLGGPRVDRLRENTAAGLRVADEYVWMYGEKFRWWPTPSRSVKPESWNEALPGSEDALRFARDPSDFGRRRIADLEKAGKLVSLTRNGDFGSEKADLGGGQAADWKTGGAPAGWSTWQESSSKGTFTWDREAGAAGKGAARAAGVGGGCFIQGCDAKPGERYAASAVTKANGRGGGWMRVRWQTADNKWTAEEQDKVFVPAGKAGEWGAIFGVVSVPEGAGRLLILLGVGGQNSPEDTLWFDDVRLIKLD